MTRKIIFNRLELELMSIALMISYGDSQKGKLTYSMSKRGLPGFHDCSSFVYEAMKRAGFLPKNTGLGNTETLFKLNGSVLKEISKEQIKKGCLFIAGWEGASAGSAGHTGYFETDWTGSMDSMKICHCSYSFGSRNVVSTKARGYMGDYSGLPVRYFKIVSAATPGEVSNENQTQQRMLAIDGSWGPATTRRLQELLACSVRDGVISGQIKNRANRNIPSAQFGSGGSNVVRALQKLVNASQDGNFGPATCKLLQQRMGTLQDGEISAVSDCVKAMQRRLNENKI